MEMEVGLPTPTLLQGDDALTTGSLPAGRYASFVHTGPYSELHDANMKLDGWVRQQGLDFAGREEGDRFVGATRLEIYLKDEGEDPSGFPVTEVAFRLAD